MMIKVCPKCASPEGSEDLSTGEITCSKCGYSGKANKTLPENVMGPSSVYGGPRHNPLPPNTIPNPEERNSPKQNTDLVFDIIKKNPPPPPPKKKIVLPD